MGNNQVTLCKRRNSDSNFYHPNDIKIKKNSPLKPRKLNKDDFKILRVIGRGSFGKVFLVEKKDNKELFAMKVLGKEDIMT